MQHEAMLGGDEPAEERHESQADRICWLSFVSLAVLCSSAALVAVYTSWQSPLDGKIVPNSFEYYLYCMVGGVLSGLPHTLLTPVDLIKCRLQVGEYTGFQQGFQSILAEGRGSVHQTVFLLFRGWAPTFVGYSIQGALKFGLYEFFKYTYATRLFTPDFALHHKVTLYLLASMSAELIADVGLSPWEAVKIKMQTTRLYRPLLRVVIPRMWMTEGISAFYKGLTPLWARQVPYTMMKFASFEKIVELIYAAFVVGPPTKATQLAVSVLAGLLAGALCAAVSHPADTLVSKLNQRSDVRSGLAATVAALSCADLWRGLGVRLVMIGTLTAMQWLIYDSFKVSVGLPTTGGRSAPPAGDASPQTTLAIS